MNKVFVLRDLMQAKRLWAFLKANAKACAQANRPLQITITYYKKQRSIPQNKMLHKLLTIMVENAWVNGRQYDLETWKEHLRRTFIGVEEIELPSGEVVERGISTTTLDVEDFSIFLDQVQHFMTTTLGLEYELSQ